MYVLMDCLIIMIGFLKPVLVMHVHVRQLLFYNYEFCQDFIGFELNHVLEVNGLTVVTS